MIQKGTIVNIIDNSGAKKAICIGIKKQGYKQKYAILGTLILVSIRKLNKSQNKKVKKGEKYNALILRTKSVIFNNTSNFKKFTDNSVLLLNKKNKFIGTRIFGLVPKILKKTKFLKLLSISAGIAI